MSRRRPPKKWRVGGGGAGRPVQCVGGARASGSSQFLDSPRRLPPQRTGATSWGLAQRRARRVGRGPPTPPVVTSTSGDWGKGAPPDGRHHRGGTLPSPYGLTDPAQSHPRPRPPAPPSRRPHRHTRHAPISARRMRSGGRRQPGTRDPTAAGRRRHRPCSRARGACRRGGGDSRQRAAAARGATSHHAGQPASSPVAPSPPLHQTRRGGEGGERSAAARRNCGVPSLPQTRFEWGRRAGGGGGTPDALAARVQATLPVGRAPRRRRLHGGGLATAATAATVGRSGCACGRG